MNSILCSGITGKQWYNSNFIQKKLWYMLWHWIIPVTVWDCHVNLQDNGTVGLSRFLQCRPKYMNCGCMWFICAFFSWCCYFFVWISAMFYGINYPVILLLCNRRIHVAFVFCYWVNQLLQSSRLKDFSM